MKVMLLDGQYQHTLPIAAELVRDLGATIFGVAPSHRSHLHRSRYVEHRLLAPLAASDAYAARITQLAWEIMPDVIVPVGYHSFQQLIELRDNLPQSAVLVAPSSAAFQVAESKSRTYELASRVGVDYPRDLTSAWANTEERERIPFPIFAKARLERGGQSTAFIPSLEFLNQFDANSIGGDILLQEFIDGDRFTYAHSGFFINGEAIVTHQHKEIRSVPRHGGSGTRLQTYFDPVLAEQANRLLRDLRWDGVAQVEFKRRADGQLVLMEINPKFWASYALASRSGSRVAAAAVAHAVGRKQDDVRKRKPRNLEMVFPLREGMYVISNFGDENLFQSIGAMLWPPAVWDVDPLDFYANIPLPRSRRSIDKA